MTERKNDLYPLEWALKVAAEKSDLATFPQSDNYYQKYMEIVSQLRRDVYPKINAGLAALSDVSGLYTSHDGSHFDIVVLYAGKILKLKNISDVENIEDKIADNKWILSCYEIYLLLLSIRFHDVGNIFGRENHERNISKVIRKYNIVHLRNNRIEARKICKIAGAHGGRTQSGSKDTIGALTEDSSVDGHVSNIDFRKIAAITRLADEICENRHRDGELVESAIPENNLVYHRFAYSIKNNYLKDKQLYLNLEVPLSECLRKFSLPKNKEVDLSSIIIERLIKSELERRYCNRFLPTEIQIIEIHVTIKIMDDSEGEDDIMAETLDTINITLEESDYPDIKVLAPLVIDKETRERLKPERLEELAKEAVINE